MPSFGMNTRIGELMIIRANTVGLSYCYLIGLTEVVYNTQERER